MRVRRTYTTEEVHRMTGMSIYTIRVQVRKNEFPVMPISGGGKGKDFLFPKKKVDDWLDGRKIYNPYPSGSGPRHS
ncbi:MAG: helix-turn-helix domain-containing protein [Nitrospirae bacterium]|nr:helix-turn-helix domain-containing protein [Nitrospirota bacterium]